MIIMHSYAYNDKTCKLIKLLLLLLLKAHIFSDRRGARGRNQTLCNLFIIADRSSQRILNAFINPSRASG